jgi:hypothetical protein
VSTEEQPGLSAEELAAELALQALSTPRRAKVTSARQEH